MIIKRTFLIFLDGVGVGAAPDAEQYGDAGSNTWGHVAAAYGGLHLPNLAQFGLAHILAVEGVAKSDSPAAGYGKMTETAPGKDSISGHWEVCGLPLRQAFPVYPLGFPAEVIDPFVERSGVSGVLGNIPMSGTEILIRLGEEHVRTGKPIVYTSADSVFQIAAHDSVIPLERLYEICEIARDLLSGTHAVGRVIARPFIGESADSFQRTANRKDYPVLPPGPTLISRLQENRFATTAVGKIYDLFAGIGFDRKVKSASNAEGMDKILEMSDTQQKGLIACTLVDFDTLWGHRNDVPHFAQDLEAFDAWLPALQSRMNRQDLLVITADHGCDPTFPGTDHTREYVPLLVYSPGMTAGVNLGIRQSYADVTATITTLMGVPGTGHGTSFHQLLPFAT